MGSERKMERKDLQGLVFDIQRFSVHDGPGIRTTVFLKGCPLRCAWCHNPESQSKNVELAFYPARCVGCGNCVSACAYGCHSVDGPVHEIRRPDCTVCGVCVETCYSGALALIGNTMTVSQVMEEVMADRLFYEVSGGGMTVSGGEPMAQPAFTLGLLKAAKARGIHTCLDTCGYCGPEDLIRAIPYTDTFLFDLKAPSDIHEQWTGVPLEPILCSLHALDDAGGNITLRCPLIPGINRSDEHLINIAEIAASLKHITGIQIVPYHPVGLAKCEAIGKEPAYSETKSLGAEEAEKWADHLRELTCVPVTVV